MESSSIAALLTAILLIGGVAAAAGMSMMKSGQPEPMAPMGNGGHMGDHGGHGEDHDGATSPCPNCTGTPHRGEHYDDDHGSHHEDRERKGHDECPCSGNYTLVWVNATVTGVSVEDRIVEIASGNYTNVSLIIKKMYVENSTGYLVYGPWILGQLEPGMNITVLIPSTALENGYGPLMGIEVDGRILVSPMSQGEHGHGYSES